MLLHLETLFKRAFQSFLMWSWRLQRKNVFKKNNAKMSFHDVIKILLIRLNLPIKLWIFIQSKYFVLIAAFLTHETYFRLLISRIKKKKFTQQKNWKKKCFSFHMNI